ncbi:MAG: hypothetical protein KIT73_07860 [Burkholderiales bacterium]|nr:hypothetical protein [Burkholderiales bacterium]
MGKSKSGPDEIRRQWLVRALAAGLLAGGMPRAGAQVGGQVPKPLPAGRSIYEVKGNVLVNGERATVGTRIAANDVIEVSSGGKLIFVVGTDAFILREKSRLQMTGTDGVVNLLRLTTGALLSVFGRTPKPKQLQGMTATIGIRGTGLYLEAEPDRTYVCTCYGRVDIAASDDPAINETITATHHDDPRYVFGPDARDKRIVPAPFKNHDDLELMLIEALVGRKPPFSLFDEGYGGPRRY